MCIKFQLGQSMHLHFMAKNTKCVKKRRNKGRNYFKIVPVHISRLAGAICFKFGMYIFLVLGHLSNKFG